LKIRLSTDSQIRQDVTDDLGWDAALDATRISVGVNDGCVTLSGTVSSVAEQWEAEQVTRQILGVNGVIIHLVTVPRLHRSDSDIAQAAQNALTTLSSIPADAIRVRVDDAWIHLSGKVAWQYQRQNALGAVRAFAGVRGITDAITLEGEPPACTMQHDIERALARQLGSDASAVGVAVHGDAVILSGQVQRWAQRELAIKTVWNAVGVRVVTDTIKLRP
jgi:osmotically-inducible protein OsmY